MSVFNKRVGTLRLVTGSVSISLISHVPNLVLWLAYHLWHHVKCFSGFETDHVCLYLRGDRGLVAVSICDVTIRDTIVRRNTLGHGRIHDTLSLCIVFS